MSHCLCFLKYFQLELDTDRNAELLANRQQFMHPEVEEPISDVYSKDKRSSSVWTLFLREKYEIRVLDATRDCFRSVQNQYRLMEKVTDHLCVWENWEINWEVMLGV